MKKTYLYIGNRNKNSGGITLYTKRESEQEYQYTKTMFADVCASKMLIDESRKMLYCVDEKTISKERCGGRIYGFKINDQTGELSMVNYLDTCTSLPCYLSLDSRKEHLLVSNYATRSPIFQYKRIEDGSVIPQIAYDESVIQRFPLLNNGEIGKVKNIWYPEKKSYKRELDNSHFHCIVKHPKYDLWSVADLGKSILYLIIIKDGKLDAISQAEVPYDMPRLRYCIFHPEKPYVYCNGENTNRIFVFRYDATQIDYYGNCILNKFPAETNQADICISEDGKYLYTLVRNKSENAVVRLKINATGERLSYEGKFDLGAYVPKGMLHIDDAKDFFVACPENDVVLQCFYQPGDKVKNIRCLSEGLNHPQCVVKLEV